MSNPWIHVRLTGRVRLREQRRLFGPSLMVVEVEEARIAVLASLPGVGSLVWRDLAPNDVHRLMVKRDRS